MGCVRGRRAWAAWGVARTTASVSTSKGVRWLVRQASSSWHTELTLCARIREILSHGELGDQELSTWLGDRIGERGGVALPWERPRPSRPKKEAPLLALLTKLEIPDVLVTMELSRKIRLHH